MSIQEQRIVQTDALPLNKVAPLELGAQNVFASAAMKSTNQNQLQNNLVNQGGGVRKRKRHIRGGANGVANESAPVVVVTAAPSYDTNPAVTNANNTQLATLANIVSSQATLDKTVGGTQAQAAAISAKNEAIYYGNGGSRRRTFDKKGGACPVWGCFSGGKKSRRYNKKCKGKGKKSRKRVKIYHRRYKTIKR